MIKDVNTKQIIDFCVIIFGCKQRHKLCIYRKIENQKLCKGQLLWNKVSNRMSILLVSLFNKFSYVRSFVNWKFVLYVISSFTILVRWFVTKMSAKMSVHSRSSTILRSETIFKNILKKYCHDELSKRICSEKDKRVYRKIALREVMCLLVLHSKPSYIVHVTAELLSVNLSTILSIKWCHCI